MDEPIKGRLDTDEQPSNPIAPSPRSRVPIAPLSSIAEILAGWDQTDGPRYRRLAENIRGGIERGILTGGTHLPPERQLSAYLGTARNTVVRAYRELVRQGLVTRRQGSGTVVLASLSPLATQPAELSSVLEGNVVTRLVAESRVSTYDLLGAHAAACEEVDAMICEAIGEIDPRELLAQPGYYSLGYPPLRLAIAMHLTDRGLRTTTDQILVTNGAQQAISLIATGLLRGRRTVVAEDPTFPGAIDGFRMIGARVLTIPVAKDDTGADRLSELLEEHEIALAYLVPTFHNPTGILMSPTARSKLAQLADSTGLILVEDEATADLAVSSDSAPPIAAFAEEGIVLSVGSLSKLFWGGLRIGWIRGPKELIVHLGQVKAIADLGTSVLSQAVAVALFHHTEGIREARQRQIATSLSHVEERLRVQLPDWRWNRPAGGLSLWARIPRGSASAFSHVALRHGVAVVPGPVMSPHGGFDDHIRLPLGRPATDMTRAIERIASAWREYCAIPVADDDDLRVVV